MLISFSFKNYRSFNDEQTLSMIGGSARNKLNHQYNLGDHGIQKFAAIYGANASGKSNIFKAINVSKMVITNDKFTFKSDDCIDPSIELYAIRKRYNPEQFKELEKTLEPNVLHKVNNHAEKMYEHREGFPFDLDQDYCRLKSSNALINTAFEYIISISGKLYKYGFEISRAEREKIQFFEKYKRRDFDVSITDEWIHEVSFNGERDRIIFERNRLEDSDLQDAQYFYDKYASQHERKNLFLNQLTRFDPSGDKSTSVFEELKKIAKWFKDTLVLIDSYSSLMIQVKIDNPEIRKKIYDIVHDFDIGITDVGFIKRGDEPPEREDRKRFAPRAPIVVGGGMISGESTTISLENGELCLAHGDNDPIPLSEESDGTRRLMNLISILISDDADKTYVVDELDQRLHPLITMEFVKRFLKKEFNNHIQLIVTTHETKLLEYDLLRHDEIWFVDKKNDLSSELYSLEEFNERFDRRIEKSYFEGRYDGIPHIKNRC